MKIIRVLLPLFLLLLSLSGCAFGAAPEPTSTVTAIPSQTPLPTATLTPLVTQTPTPTNTPVLTPTQAPLSLPEIKTVEESLSIQKIELTDEFMFDNPAPAGMQYLTIWLVRSDGIAIDVLYFLKIEPRSKEIYLVASDGTQWQKSGFGNSDDMLFVRFTVPKTAQGFQFYWPDNDLIDLGFSTGQDA